MVNEKKKGKTMTKSQALASHRQGGCCLSTQGKEGGCCAHAQLLWAHSNPKAWSPALCLLEVTSQICDSLHVEEGGEVYQDGLRSLKVAALATRWLALCGWEWLLPNHQSPHGHIRH